MGPMAKMKLPRPCRSTYRMFKFSDNVAFLKTHKSIMGRKTRTSLNLSTRSGFQPLIGFIFIAYNKISNVEESEWLRPLGKTQRKRN